MVVDATATPAMAQDLIRAIRGVTDKPIRHVALTHYHAVRVLGASAFAAEGAATVIASRGTHELIVERGQADMDSEIGRFPRLFRSSESIPGLTWPTLVFERELTIRLGTLEVRMMHLGNGHTRGDSVVWIPSQGICFAGDLVEFNAGVYTGDAYLADWPATLDRLEALRPAQMVPGRGPALTTPQDCREAIGYTRRWVQTLYGCARGRGRRQVAQAGLCGHATRDGSGVRPCRHLRTRDSLRRLARLRRSQRHRRPARLDRRARPRHVGRAEQLKRRPDEPRRRLTP